MRYQDRLTRVAVQIKVQDCIAYCVFQGGFLEHLFLGTEIPERVLLEVNSSNFGLGRPYKGDLETLCESIVSKALDSVKYRR